MSGEGDQRNDEKELEALLRGLVPNPLDVEFVASLHRDRERVAAEREQSPTRMQWSRVVPLTLVCTVVMFGYAIHQYGDRLSEARRSSPEPGTAGSAPASPALVAESPSVPVPDSRFVPVSSHGTIVNTSSGGLVETEEGPRQRLNIEYRDAYHWHDPESGTNIRYFLPRSEEVIVPLPAD